MPVWSQAEFLERARDWRETYLASGCYGSTNLLSKDSLKLVVKTLRFGNKQTFVREAKVKYIYHQSSLFHELNVEQ